MNIVDLPIKIDRMGYFICLAPIGDEHYESPTQNKRGIFILKSSIEEARRMFRCPIGFLKFGDELEYDRKSFSEKLQAVGKPCDRAGHEQMAKSIVDKIRHHYTDMFKKGDKRIAAVSGNHKVNFTIGEKERRDMKEHGIIPDINTSQMLVERLGFPYMGDGHCMVNIHLDCKHHRRIYKIIMLHGAGMGSSEAADMQELKKVREMYGDVDMIIKAHSHKPMTTHWGRYNTNNMSSKSKHIDVLETTVINIGSMRGAMGLGFTDYGEKAEYRPIPTRFPFIALKAIRHNTGQQIEIRAIPITY